MRMHRTGPTILAAALALSACSDGGPTAIEIPLARVQITERCSAPIPVDQSCQIRAVGITAENQLVTNAVLRWSSSASSVASVDSDGRVRGLSPGQSVITVEAALGTGSATTTVSVNQVFPK